MVVDAAILHWPALRWPNCNDSRKKKSQNERPRPTRAETPTRKDEKAENRLPAGRRAAVAAGWEKMWPLSHFRRIDYQFDFRCNDCPEA